MVWTSTPRLSAAGVVGRLDGHLHAVRVALLERGGGDPDEPALVLQLGDGAGADVEHRLVEAADELVGDRGQRTAVGDLALDALGDDLVVAGDLGLEVAVLGVRLLATAAHRAERAHPAVGLELLAVDEHDVAGRLLAPGEHRADHHRVGAGDERLGDLAGVLHPAVGDQRDAGRLRGQGRLVDRGHLRHADARDDAGRADRAAVRRRP